ncbi:hypothetical protein GALMADRAFT_146449 [Galerina marginata CBS 339.88]|uniref:Uncharacterized protein n=1 Tax=Galerina marginata (strain CBS 339.88) TaxID=685588 RepID=A0A067SB96_GALM3|nr:hypothetical protein GALMADRAFT_146449 [Galerina marginata CBS 339.88]
MITLQTFSRSVSHFSHTSTTVSVFGHSPPTYMDNCTVVRPLATSYLRPSRYHASGKLQYTSRTNPSQIAFFAWVLANTTHLDSYNRRSLADAVLVAMNTEAIQTSLRNALGRSSDVHLVATRAVASPSNTCSEPHFTARVFMASGEFRYLGGIHIYPAKATTSSTFIPQSQEKAKKWKSRRFNSDFFSILVL